jgi:hypothetical protein
MNMLQYSIHFVNVAGWLMLKCQMYNKEHGEVKVDIMLLLIANNC